VNLAQDFSPGTALRVNDLVPGGTESLLCGPALSVLKLIFTQSLSALGILAGCGAD
jgi:hypothetical protein